MTTTIFKGVSFVSGFFFKEHIPQIIYSAAYSMRNVGNHFLQSYLVGFFVCDYITANVYSDFWRALEWLINCACSCCYYNCFVCFFVSTRN